MSVHNPASFSILWPNEWSPCQYTTQRHSQSCDPMNGPHVGTQPNLISSLVTQWIDPMSVHNPTSFPVLWPIVNLPKTILKSPLWCSSSNCRKFKTMLLALSWEFPKLITNLFILLLCASCTMIHAYSTNWAASASTLTAPGYLTELKISKNQPTSHNPLFFGYFHSLFCLCDTHFVGGCFLMLNCPSGTPSLGKLGHQTISPFKYKGYKRVPKLVYFDSLFFALEWAMCSSLEK